MTRLLWLWWTQLFAAFASCQVYPSEYAYHKNSVTRSERDSANCVNYPKLATEIQTFSEHYIHCNGIQLRLSDSEVGSQSQYNSSYHYEWSAESQIRRLLFIFPTRINLTTITLHYYSDSQRGLPPLRFYAVPDDFDVWDGVPTSSSHVTIAAAPPGDEPEGLRNVSIDFNFSTRKILMVKAASTYSLAVSEVQFFVCTEGKSTIKLTAIKGFITHYFALYYKQSSLLQLGPSLSKPHPPLKWRLQNKQTVREQRLLPLLQLTRVSEWSHHGILLKCLIFFVVWCGSMFIDLLCDAHTMSCSLGSN